MKKYKKKKIERWINNKKDRCTSVGKKHISEKKGRGNGGNVGANGKEPWEAQGGQP